MSSVVVSLLSFSANSMASDAAAYRYFSAQTYALFDKSDVEIAVRNSKIIDDKDKVTVVADIQITTLRSRDEIANSVRNRIMKDYMSPTIPKSIGAEPTKEEADYYAKMTTGSIADYIVTATLGAIGSEQAVIERAGSRVVVFKDESGKKYLNILGRSLYVD